MNEPNPPTENQRSPRPKARYIMIGGFLGAGKTTSVARLARRLTDRGFRVGLITNDQGNELVDTAMLRSKGFATEEILGGCFCCRFNSLVDAADRLSASARPDVFIAEPVGSCTDLVATVTYPLRRMYGDSFSIAALSVLVDPVRALRIFGLEPGGKFSDKVLYIYRKQLEEADVIVINKCDLLHEARLAALRQTLIANFPDAELLEISARNGNGLDAWFNRIADGNQPSGSAMEVDYETYADGEALLGWLNCTAQVSAPDSFEANALLTQLATDLQRRLDDEGAEVAHLKMTLSPDEGLGDIAVINLVGNDFIPELSQELPDPIVSGQLIINLRAETSPGTLNNAVQAAIEHCRRANPPLTIALQHLEHFRPGKPTPTHRIAHLT